MVNAFYEAVASGIRFRVSYVDADAQRAYFTHVDDGQDGGHVDFKDLQDPERFRPLIQYCGILQFE
jgi:hypothetical protein